MKLSIAITLLCLPVFSWADTSDGEPGEDPLVEQLRCREVHFSQTVERRDLTAFRNMMDSDTRWVTPGGVLHGPDQVVNAWQVFFSDSGPQIAWRPAVTQVLASGDLALSRGPFRMRGTSPDGQAFERWGLFQSVWRRAENGEWLIVFDAGAEDGMTPSDDQRALLEQETDCEEAL